MEPDPMPTAPVSQQELAPWPDTSACPRGGFQLNLARSSLRGVEIKEFIFAEGDPISHVYLVEAGAVALYKVLADGRRQIVCFAYPGDFIGLGAHGEHLMNAQAIKPTRLRCLPVTLLRQCASRDPLIGLQLYEALAGELAATRDLMLTIGRRSAMERVAGFLLAFSRRNQSNGQDRSSFELPMTRADIADFLGLDHRNGQPHVHEAEDARTDRSAAQ
jgi:CRP/FNR family transcriptional regulator